ncbi:hypothetical protein DPEC_G00108880 [Dallia pectoralis]|uniref:Uncharacterized protein n=1 Tax=Dallia pectoralis TaxID=75939 RepID=A0ACC2GT47_DALPE|nr:hypothetical protein DPEC_G00108880 [Dallia pectoralis]
MCLPLLPVPPVWDTRRLCFGSHELSLPLPDYRGCDCRGACLAPWEHEEIDGSQRKAPCPSSGAAVSRASGAHRAISRGGSHDATHHAPDLLDITSKVVAVRAGILQIR